jgi:hypothetical protein
MLLVYTNVCKTFPMHFKCCLLRQFDQYAKYCICKWVVPFVFFFQNYLYTNSELFEIYKTCEHILYNVYKSSDEKNVFRGEQIVFA